MPPRCDGGAWNGDKGSAVIRPDPKNPDRQTAVVTAVLERRNRTVIGAAERRGREVWVQPSSDRLPHAVKVVGRTSSIRPGDKIALCGKDSSDWVRTYIGIVTYGAVVVPILADFNPIDITHIVNHSGATILAVQELSLIHL